MISGYKIPAESVSPGLYIVATPIGNLKDITLRALNVLAAADAIFAEDTRVTRKLLSHYGIRTALLSYHEHSDLTVEDKIMQRLQDKQVIALVSDAGTPLISDPGFRLMQKIINADIACTSVPGPSALINALVLSGLPSDHFYFEGFLPQKSTARKERLNAIRMIEGSLILYEAPHRLAKMLADAAVILGARQACIARELTKYYESIHRGNLHELADYYAENGAPKGEIVILMEGFSPQTESCHTDEYLDDLLRETLTRHSVKDTAALIAAETGLPKKQIYSRALDMAEEQKSRQAEIFSGEK